MVQKRRVISISLTALTVLLFLLAMFPFFVVIINSAKESLEIIVNPLSMPKQWSQMWENVKEIWNNPSIRYPSSVMSSAIITIGSLTAISLFSAKIGRAHV